MGATRWCGPRAGATALLLTALILVTASACRKEEERRPVSLRPPGPPGGAPAPTPVPVRGLRVALGGIITPKEGLAYYLEFLRYLEKRLGQPIIYSDKEDYAEINRMLRDGEVDFAFVCSGPYVEGKRSFGLRLVAAPQAYGLTSYRSYIIVPRESTARSLDDLRGGSFAFTDPLSNTGNLVPTFMLAQRRETKESFFKTTTFTHGHDKSIKAVAEGLVDGAAVDSLIWEYYQRKDPATTGRTRVIATSPPYGIPPVVVRSGLDDGTGARLKEVLLDAHRDPQGEAILKAMMIDRFVEVDDSIYDSIREMMVWLEREGRKPK
jgi:phosphonate transport system substrate-binding protein